MRLPATGYEPLALKATRVLVEIPVLGAKVKNATGEPGVFVIADTSRMSTDANCPKTPDPVLCWFVPTGLTLIVTKFETADASDGGAV
jgi:hypothetical protein